MRHLFAFVFAAVVSACVPAGGYQSTYSQPSYAQSSAAQPATSYQATGAYGSAAHGTAAYGAAAYGTGVYINGEQLTAEQKAELDGLLGEAIPAGRYALDAQYHFGYEGQAPVINLKAYIAQRQRGAGAPASAGESSESGKPFSMYSRDSAGQGSSLVSDGNGCMIMSTPSGSLSSGC